MNKEKKINLINDRITELKKIYFYSKKMSGGKRSREIEKEGYSYFKPKLFEPLIDKLFCFSGKKFTCTLCLGSTTSPKRWPISLLSTCLHRFHTKCIEKHVEKSREWHDECQQNWALHVKLACPTCREPFNRSHILTDTFTAEICKYESSSSDDET